MTMSYSLDSAIGGDAGSAPSGGMRRAGGGYSSVGSSYGSFESISDAAYRNDASISTTGDDVIVGVPIPGRGGRGGASRHHGAGRWRNAASGNSHGDAGRRSTPLGRRRSDGAAYRDGSRGSCRVALISALSAPINLGWAAGEALIVPYLLEQGVSASTASFVWLINPLVGLLLQPLFAACSDGCHSRMGRRRPFLLAFTLTSLLGLATVGFGKQVLAAHGVQSRAPLVAVLFIGYGLMDLSHDLLVTPARSLLLDSISSTGQPVQHALSWYAATGSLGRFVGLAIAAAPVESAGFLPPELRAFHVRAVFFVVFVLIAIQNLLTIVVAKEIPLDAIEAQAMLRTSALNGDGYGAVTPATMSSARKSREAALAGRSPGRVPVWPDDDDYAYGDSEYQEDSGRQHAMTDVSSNSGTPMLRDGETPQRGFVSLVCSLCCMRRDIALLWAVTFFGWVVFHIQCFFWTTWVGEVVFGGVPAASNSTVAASSGLKENVQSDVDKFERGVVWGTIGLAVQALSGIVFAYILPCLNRAFGTKRVFYVLELGFLAAVACMALAGAQTKWGSLAIAIATGVFPAVHGTNSYIILELLTDARERATWVSVLNLSMVVAQIVVAVSAGEIMEGAPALPVVPGTLHVEGLTIVFVGAAVVAGMADMLLFISDRAKYIIPVA